VYEYTTEVDGEDVDHAILFVGTMEGELAAYDLLNARAPLWAPLTLDLSVLYGPPVASGEYVYIGTSAATVYKIPLDINAEPIKSIGLKGAENDDTIIGGVAVELGCVFVGTSNGILYALDADDLSIKWRYPAAGATLSNRIWGTPTVDVTGEDSGVVYFGGFDHKLYALDASTGEEIWDEPFEADGAIAGKPLVYDGKVYFGSFDRKFYALDITDGELAWATPFTAGNWFWTEPIVNEDDGTIYVGCLDHKVYALDAVTGVMKSEYKTDSPVTSPPVLAGNILIVAANSGKVYARDAANLVSEKWPVYNLGAPIQSPMSVHGDFVYVYGRNSKLTARWLTTGGQSGWDINTAE